MAVLAQQLLECVALEALRPDSAADANVNEQRQPESSAAFDSIDGFNKLRRVIAPAVVAPGEEGRLGHGGHAKDNTLCLNDSEDNIILALEFRTNQGSKTLF